MGVSVKYSAIKKNINIMINAFKVPFFFGAFPSK